MPNLGPFGQALRGLAEKAGSGAIRATEAAIVKGKPIVEKIGEATAPMRNRFEAHVGLPLEMRLGEIANPTKKALREDLEKNLREVREAFAKADAQAKPTGTVPPEEKEKLEAIHKWLSSTTENNAVDALKKVRARIRAKNSGASMYMAQEKVNMVVADELTAAAEAGIGIERPAHAHWPKADVLNTRKKIREALLENQPFMQEEFDLIESLFSDVRTVKNPADIPKLIDRLLHPNNEAEVNANMDLFANIAKALAAVAPKGLVEMAGPAPQGVYHLLAGGGRPTNFGITIERMLRHPHALERFTRTLVSANPRASLEHVNAAKNFLSHFPDSDMQIGDFIPVNGHDLLSNSVGQAFLVRNARGGYNLVDDYRFYDTQSRGLKSMPPTLKDREKHGINATEAWDASKGIVGGYAKSLRARMAHPVVTSLAELARKTYPARGNTPPNILRLLEGLETRLKDEVTADPNFQNVGWYIDRMLHRKGTPYPVVIEDIDRIMAASLFHKQTGRIPPAELVRGGRSQTGLRAVEDFDTYPDFAKHGKEDTQLFAKLLSQVRRKLPKKTMQDMLRKEGREVAAESTWVGEPGTVWPDLVRNFDNWMANEYPAFTGVGWDRDKTISREIFLTPIEAVLLDDFLKHQKNGTLQYFTQNKELVASLQEQLSTKGFPRIDNLSKLEPFDVFNTISRAFDYARTMDPKVPRAEAIAALLKKHGYEPPFTQLPRTSKLYAARAEQATRFHGDVEELPGLTAAEVKVVRNMMKDGVIPPGIKPEQVGFDDIAKYFDSLPEETQNALLVDTGTSGFRDKTLEASIKRALEWEPPTMTSRMKKTDGMTRYHDELSRAITHAFDDGLKNPEARPPVIVEISKLLGLVSSLDDALAGQGIVIFPGSKNEVSRVATAFFTEGIRDNDSVIAREAVNMATNWAKRYFEIAEHKHIQSNNRVLQELDAQMQQIYEVATAQPGINAELSQSRAGQLSLNGFLSSQAFMNSLLGG